MERALDKLHHLIINSTRVISITRSYLYRYIYDAAQVSPQKLLVYGRTSMRGYQPVT